MKNEIELRDYPKLCYFKGWVLQNFPYIEQNFDALTNYELICKITEYLNNVIKNENIVQENMIKISQAFNNLIEWFDNLNVQDEINNKLDDMAKSGELEEIIASYINTNSMLIFDSVYDMKSSTNLVNGSFCKTLGYHSMNDFGGANYLIIEKTESIIIDEMTFIEINNNLVAKLLYDNLNVKQLGAYADNIHDDSIYFNKAIELLSKNKTSTNYNSNNILYIPAGEYLISNTINLSVYVKLESIGYVTLNSLCENVCLKLSPLGIPQQSGSEVERYNYLFGELINGKNGFRIINKLENRGSTIAISLGDDNVLNSTLNYNISKASINYVTINNFNVGLQINPYNFYLIDFNHVYMEQNNNCIRVGRENIDNYFDSGENISFNNCIFAGSNIVCLYVTPKEAIDFNFNECSFDYNNCLFYSPNNNEQNSPTRKISITNSHIEQTSYQVTSDSDIHGILYGQFRAYQITISNSRILQTNNYHLFYSEAPTSYVLNLISNIIITYNIQDADNPAYQYYANDNVGNINLFNNNCSTQVGISSKLSSINNCVFMPDFRRVTTASIELTKSTTDGSIIGDFMNAYFNKINNSVNIIDNILGGKSLQLKVDVNNPWSESTQNSTVSFSLSTKNIQVKSGDKFGIGIIYKNLRVNNLINFYMNCYDINNNLIETINVTTPSKISSEYVNTYLPRYMQAPTGTHHVSFRVSLDQNNNDNQIQNDLFEIANISIVKI